MLAAVYSQAFAPKLHWSRLVFLGAFLLLSLAVLATMRINGDGGEYLMTTHAFAQHASPRILSADFVEFLRQPWTARARIAYPSELYTQLVDNFHVAHPESWAGYASVRPDEIYAIHFWLYSLLALPFYVLLKLVGLNPVIAFGIVNLGFLVLLAHYLRRACAHAFGAVVLVLSMGTTFYLGWTGPEVMTACCALIACIALQRGETARALLFAGLGASQNPSLIMLMPIACVARLAYLRWPALIWPGAALAPLTRRDVGVGGAGVALALIPYLWFEYLFGIPSITGRYFAYPGLISWNRFHSLPFDLDQGMVLGVPGLFAGLLACACLMARARRWQWAASAGLMACACVAAMVPTLATLNWNSGSVVFMRYAYWLAMPLLSLLILAFNYLTRAQLRWLLVLVFSLQLVVLTQYGVLGRRVDGGGHSRLALWMLAHYPAYYNPDAEIFYERSVGAEKNAPLDHALSHLYFNGAAPAKLLRHASNQGASADLCPPGQRLEGSDVRTIDAGWQYAHAPFRCVKLALYAPVRAWTFDRAHADAAKLLVSGWSGAETAGTWTDGRHARLRIPLAGLGSGALRLRVGGWYYAAQDGSGVSVDGRALGKLNLAGAVIALPAPARGADALIIEFDHPDAQSPKQRGESGDPRLLGFQLQSLTLEQSAD